jgi:HlyD family secretion protein
MASGKLKGKWKLITGIAVGIIVVGLAGWYFLGSKNEVQAQMATSPVTKGTIDVKVSGTGNVEPADTSNVIAKTGGGITGISVANGQHIKKGQLLFTLDNSNLQAQIEKAKID